jgi:hypothetical protein
LLARCRASRPPDEEVRGNQMSSEAIRCNLEAIRGHLELGHLMREAIRGHRRQSEVIKAAGSPWLD